MGKHFQCFSLHFAAIWKEYTFYFYYKLGDPISGIMVGVLSVGVGHLEGMWLQQCDGIEQGQM